MEPSSKNHAIQWDLFLWSNARWRYWKCGLYTQLKAATINHLQISIFSFFTNTIFWLNFTLLQNNYQSVIVLSFYSKFA